ncbi:MAG: hypothetical protein ABF379_11970 [Akkermansiaceae bacterium]
MLKWTGAVEAVDGGAKAEEQGVSEHGWSSATFGKVAKAREELAKWIEGSCRAPAPKTVVKQLDENG